MRAMRILAAMLLAAMGAAAGAQSPAAAEADGVLRKCIAADGAVSYQDRPCAASEQLSWERVVEPEPDGPSRATPTPPASSRGADRGGRRSYSYRSAPRPAVDRCATARMHREDVLRTVGLKRTFSLLRQLDDQVANACRRR